jgi:hypothetical protein
MSVSTYDKLLLAFSKEISATFPELSSQSDRAVSTTPAQFLDSWIKDLHILRDRNNELLFSQRKGLLIDTLCMTPELFAESSEATVSAIWKYLRTLLLESAKIVKLDSLDFSASKIVFEILADEKIGANDSKGMPDMGDMNFDKIKQIMDDFKPFIDKLKDMVTQFLSGDSDFNLDLSGLSGLSNNILNLSGFTLPNIPKHLLSGHIANLAKDLMKQFQPSDFGIDPSILECEDVDEIVEKLGDLFKNDTSAILAGVKRLTEKIKNKIMNGSVRQAELIAEAKEFVALFQANPIIQECIEKVKAYFSEGPGKDVDFSTILDKFGLKGLGGFQGISEMIQSFLSGGISGASSNAPSDRRRAVQERLRKKLAKKNEAKGQR